MSLDVLTIGRSSVDLYGQQVGGRLEDMRSFAKYVGGSPTNIAVGCARLGLRAGLVTRVGDEHMGRFVAEQLAAEGVDVRGVTTDPERLTALVVLGIRDEDTFPLVFYREDCADMALSEDDIDAGLVAEARIVVATGTHLSHPRTEAAVLKALRLAREAGARTALDIDYRPNLWGLAGHGAGEARFIASDAVTAKLRSTLHLFDLIVGTEEEFAIAGGTTDVPAALRAVREVSAATLVCKRGAAGAVAIEGDVPGSLEDAIVGEGFPIEVFNVLGAGDGFMAGLLSGWARGADWATSLTRANACGAFAVSRHGCAPAYPSAAELDWFLAHGSSTRALRHDATLERIHRATNRRREWPTLRALAFDHRAQMEAMADEAGAPRERIGAFKRLCLAAAERVADGRDDGEAGFGVLCDDRTGREALHAAAGTGLWIGRPVEVPGSRPLALEVGPDLGSDLLEWPADTTVKCLVAAHPDDAPETWDAQAATLLTLQDAARANDLDLLIEPIPSRVGPVGDGTHAALIERFYASGLYPDWWKLEAHATDAAWEATCAAVRTGDPWCRGIVMLGLDAPIEAVEAALIRAARHPLVKGFAVGRTVFAGAARAWLAGRMDDDGAVDAMAARYARLCDAWDRARTTMEDAA